MSIRALPALDAPALAALSRSAAPARGYSALLGESCLVLQARRGLRPADTLRVRQWLRQLPCPTIALAGTDKDIVCACDVVLGEGEDLAPLVWNIRRNPIAASVLVQLLRATEAMAIEDGLIAESLAYATLQGGAEHQRWLKAQPPAPKAAPDPGSAVVISREGAHLTLELNRPANRNAMSVEVRDALNEAFELVLADRSIKSVQLSGRGKCFSVGGDLAEFGTVPDPATGHAIRSVALPARLLARCARRVEVVVHSACIGAGIELPAFARRVVARDNAFFHLPELSMGLIPGAGGTVSLPRRIGRQRTAWLVLAGERITAREALALGLVNSIKD